MENPHPSHENFLFAKKKRGTLPIRKEGRKTSAVKEEGEKKGVFMALL